MRISENFSIPSFTIRELRNLEKALHNFEIVNVPFAIFRPIPYPNPDPNHNLGYNPTLALTLVKWPQRILKMVLFSLEDSLNAPDISDDTL